MEVVTANKNPENKGIQIIDDNEKAYDDRFSLAFKKRKFMRRKRLVKF